MSDNPYSDIPGPDADGTQGESSWQPIDMTDAVAGGDVTEPTRLERTDGVALLYPGRVHWMQGESESLKSWAAQLAIAQALTADGSALCIDFEDDERGVASRLTALGVPAAVICDPDRFVYVRPDEPLRNAQGAVTVGEIALQPVLARLWDVVVIDGVTEAMTVEGLSLMDNADAANWMRLLPKRIAATTGAAVVCIDHVTKNRDGQGRYALGAQHKLAGVTGAVFKVEARRRLSRATTEPVTATSVITVEKDRPGWVRSQADGGTIAVLELTAYPDGAVAGQLLAPSAVVELPDWELCESILSHLTTYDGASKNQIEQAVNGKASAQREAITWMVAQAWIEVRKEGQAHRHYLTDAGRDALKDRNP